MNGWENCSAQIFQKKSFAFSPSKYCWHEVIMVLCGCQYWIRVDGSGRITLRNHHFLRKEEFQTMSTPIPSTLTEPVMFQSNIPITQTLLVMTPMQLSDTQQQELTCHHALRTHNAHHWELLEPNLNYSSITWAIKNCLLV